MGYRVGIDLGTTFSVVAYINPDTGKPEIVKNRYGESTTPSVLAFNEDGTVLFGIDAKEEKAFGNPNTASFFKRDMGDMKAEVEYWGKVYNPKDLSAILLEKLVSQAEETLGDKIDEVVITVPAYFTDAERRATLEAGQQAGLKVTGIISEPSAAAFAYGLNSSERKTVLIYDLGGGTFDVSIADISDDNINIIGTAGEHRLGGKDWDSAIVSWIESNFEESTGYEIDIDLETDARLMEIAEKAKKELSTKKSTIVRFSQNGEKIELELTRELFKDITSYYLEITKNIIDGLFEDISKTRGALFGWENIDGVILVGGSTKMKMVEEYIVDNLHKEPLRGVNEDEAVAIGAAIRANTDNNGEALPGVLHCIGSKNSGRKSVIGGKKIRDSIAHSLGMVAISEKGDEYINSIIIRKNTGIPTESTKEHMLNTSSKEKNELEVYLLQGDEYNPLDCLIAGKYVFKKIEHKNGGAKIAVTYRYNQNGMIDVEATQDGKALPMERQDVPDDISWMGEKPEVTASGGLTPIDIYLIIDLSYSMVDTISEVNKTIKSFIDKLNLNNVRIGVMGVADKVTVFQNPTTNMGAINNALSGLPDAVRYGKLGYGNATQPFHELYNLGIREKERKTVGIILADGIWDTGATADSYKYSQQCHTAGIDTIGLGFGSANEKFLRDSSSLKDLSSLSDLNGLTEGFSKIARVIGNGMIS